jgi:hypothetical protein
MTDISKNTELQQSCITAVITMLPTERKLMSGLLINPPYCNIKSVKRLKVQINTETMLQRLEKLQGN